MGPNPTADNSNMAQPGSIAGGSCCTPERRRRIHFFQTQIIITFNTVTYNCYFGNMFSSMVTQTSLHMVLQEPALQTVGDGLAEAGGSSLKRRADSRKLIGSQSAYQAPARRTIVRQNIWGTHPPWRESISCDVPKGLALSMPFRIPPSWCDDWPYIRNTYRRASTYTLSACLRHPRAAGRRGVWRSSLPTGRCRPTQICYGPPANEGSGTQKLWPKRAVYRGGAGFPGPQGTS